MRSIASLASEQDTKSVLMLHLNWQHLAAAIMSPILHHQRNMIKPTKPSLQSPYGLLKETAGTRETLAESGNSARNFSDSITLIETAQQRRAPQKPPQSQEGYGVRVQELQGIYMLHKGSYNGNSDNNGSVHAYVHSTGCSLCRSAEIILSDKLFTISGGSITRPNVIQVHHTQSLMEFYTAGCLTICLL